MAFQTEVFEGEFKISEEGVNELTTALTKLLGVADKVTGALGKITIKAPKIDTSPAEKSAATIKKTTKSVEDAITNMYNPIKSISPQTSQLIADLSNQFDNVRTRGGAAAVSLSERFRGAGLAITGTGSRLQGLREIIGGTTSSTNGFVKALDFVIKRNDPLSKLSSSLQKNIATMAETASAGTRALASQGDILKRIVAAEFNDASGAADEFNKQVTRVNSSFKQIFVTASKGGDISQGLLRARIEVRGLEDEYQLLTSRGIIKTGSESDKLFKQMITDARTTETRLEAMNQRYQGTKKEIAAAKIEQDKMTASGQKQVSIFGQIQIKFSNLFNVFRSGKQEINQTTTGLKSMESQIQKTGAAAGYFKSVFLGAFSGVALGSQIPFILDAIRNKFTGAIQAASNAEEEMSKFFTVFKDEGDVTTHVLAENVIGVLDEIAERMGRSQYQLRAIAATFQDTFVPLGFGREQAAKLSIGLTEMTEDLSSFYNLTEKEVSDSISSFLVGNYENARKFGVIVNDAALDAEILKLGIEGGTEAVDQQTKTMVALKLLYAGTADAQGDVARTSTSFANQLREIQGRALDASIAFGQKLLPVLNPLLALFIRLSDEIGPKVTYILDQFTQYITPIAGAITTLLSAGSVDEIFVTIIEAVQSGVTGMLDSLNTFLPYAAEWAYNWGIEIYNGLIDVADSLLSDAMNYIGEIIGSFLAPGSPPEQGPLAEIDTWGEGLVETFTNSMSNVNTAPLEQGLGAIRDVFSNFDLGSATADVLAIEQQIADAEAQGFIPAELKKQLALAKDKVTLLQQQQQLQEQLGQEAKENQKDIDREAAGKGGGGGGAGDGATPKGRKEVEKKTALEIKDEALKILDQQLKDGVIKYEDYAADRLKIEQKFYEDTLEEGGVVSKENIDNIKHFQDEVERLKELNKKATGKGAKVGLADLGLTVEDFLTNPVDLSNKVGEGVKKIAVAATTAFTAKIEEARGAIFTKINETFRGVFEKVAAKLKSFITPENLPIVAAITGALVSLAAPSVVSGLAAVATTIGTLALSLGKFVLLAGKFTVVGLVVTSIILNWDTIMAAVNPAWQAGAKIIADFIKKAGGISTLNIKFKTFFTKAKTEAAQFATDILAGISKLFKDWDFESALDSFKAAFSEIDLSGLTFNFGNILKPFTDAVNENLPKIKQKFLDLIPESVRTNITTAIDSLRQSFENFFAQGRLGGELLNLFKQLGELFVALLPTIKALGLVLVIVAGVIVNVVVAALQGLVSALPFVELALSGVLRVISGVVDFLTGVVLLIRSAWSAITGDSEAASATFQQALANLAAGVTGVLGGMAQVIVNTLGAVLSFAISFAGNFVANILTFIPGFQGAALFIRTLTDQLVSIMVGLSGRVLAVINGLTNQLKIILPATWLFLLNDIDNFIRAVQQFFVGLATPIVEIITGLSDQLVAIFELMKGKLISATVQIVLGVISMINEFEEDMIDAGKDLILGLIKGVIEKKDQLIDVIKDIAKQALGALADVLGISSPSIAFKDLGVSIIEGLVEGINATIPTFNDAIGAAADDAEKILDQAIDPDKVGGILDVLKNIYKANFDAISAAGAAGTDLLKSLLSQSINLQKYGIGPTQNKTIDSAIKALIGKTKTYGEQQLATFGQTQSALLAKIQQSVTDVAGAFNQQFFNIHNSATEARIQLEQLFNRTVTDAEVERIGKALEGTPIEQLDEQSRLILRNYILQKKLAEATEQEAKFKLQLNKFGQKAGIVQGLLEKLGLVEAPVDAQDTGNQIIEALGLGMDAGVGDVLSSLDSVSDSIIAKLKAAFGIASPSRVFIGFGQQLSAGLAQGILSGMSEVDGALSYLASPATGLLTGGARLNIAGIGSAGMASGSSVQIIMHNTINDDFDQVMFNARVERAVVEAIRRH